MRSIPKNPATAAHPSNRRALALFLCITVFKSALSLAAAEARQVDSFDLGWRFHLGDVVTQETVRTARQPARLEVTVDRASIAAGRRDVAFVTVHALDTDGVAVPLADNMVNFDISGPGRLIGVDNGDPASHASYQGSTRALFNGMALALVQSTPDAGVVSVSASSAGLLGAHVEFSTTTP